MSKREKITCQCGGLLSRPLPEECPHCGARLVGARRSLWPLVWPVLLIILMFAALAALLFWWVGETP